MANKTLKGNIKNMLTYEQFLNIIINDNETIYTKLDKIEKSNDLLIKYKLSTEILDTKIPDNVIAVKRVTDLIEKLQKIIILRINKSTGKLPESHSFDLRKLFYFTPQTKNHCFQ